MEPLSTLSTAKPPQMPQLPSKDLVKGPQRGPKGFYFLPILLANAKVGTESKKRMFQKLAVEDAEAII